MTGNSACMADPEAAVGQSTVILQVHWLKILPAHIFTWTALPSKAWLCPVISLHGSVFLIFYLLFFLHIKALLLSSCPQRWEYWVALFWTRWWFTPSLKKTFLLECDALSSSHYFCFAFLCQVYSFIPEIFLFWFFIHCHGITAKSFSLMY